MKKKHYLILAVLCSVLISLFTQQASCADNLAGKIIFKSKCQACHRIAGDGTSPSAYHNQYRPKDFSTSVAWGNLSEEKIKFVLTRGQGVMRPVPLNADETKALIDYMMKDLKK